MKDHRKYSHDKKFSLSSRVKSFRHAFSGLADLVRHEHNARIHLVIFLVVISAGIIFRISSIEWISIIIASGLVFISECFNTAIENISDLITDELNENIRRAKDVAAAGVLMAAIISVIVGLFVFLPHIFNITGD